MPSLLSADGRVLYRVERSRPQLNGASDRPRSSRKRSSRDGREMRDGRRPSNSARRRSRISLAPRSRLQEDWDALQSHLEAVQDGLRLALRKKKQKTKSRRRRSSKSATAGGGREGVEDGVRRQQKRSRRSSSRDRKIADDSSEALRPSLSELTDLRHRIRELEEECEKYARESSRSVPCFSLVSDS